jgi:hypothetical protein
MRQPGLESTATAAVMRSSRLGSTLRFRARPSATLVRRLLSACQPNIADWCIIAAWYEWFPAGASDFSGISFKTGDSVTITVTASSKTSGTAVIKNNSNGQSVSKSLTSSSALCQQDVEWIVEDFEGFLFLSNPCAPINDALQLAALSPLPILEPSRSRTLSQPSPMAQPSEPAMLAL